MLRCKTILLLILTSLGINPLLSGQFRFEKPVLVGRQQGLIAKGLNGVRKGKDGFVWVATSEGLYRFDGSRVKVYQQGPDKLRSPFDNVIHNVLPIGNEVWMATSQGISVLTMPHETFRHYQLTDSGKADSLMRRFDQRIHLIYCDRDSLIWIGTRDRGVWVYDKKRDDFRNFPYPADAYPGLVPALGHRTGVLSIEASRSNDSIIWVGTTAGLQKINKISGEVKWYTFLHEDKIKQVALNAFRRMYAHPDGKLYVGSWEAGVNVFDPVKETFTPIPLKPADGNIIFIGSIISILPKNDTALWITSSQGLAVYDTREQRVTWYKKNNPLKMEFYGIHHIDQDHRVWNVTLSGLQYFDPVAQQFSTYSFEDLYTGSWAFAFYNQSNATGDVITVCPLFADGLYRFDKKSSRWTKLFFRNQHGRQLTNLVVRGFVELSPGKYMLSADQGLFTYSEKDQQLRPSPVKPAVRYERWGEIMKDRKGDIWLSADAEGLIRWDLRNGRYRLYADELAISDSTGLGRVNHFLEDSRGNIWISRTSGFSVYLENRDTILNFFYHSNPRISFPNISSFQEDRTGKVWVSSSDGWYGYIDANRPEGGIIRKLNLKAIGIQDDLESLAADKQGNVWGFTSKELIRLNAATGGLSRFEFAYGDMEADFSHFSFLPTGEMIFGGRNSITLANPSTFKRNRELPVPYITGMEVLNQPMPTDFYVQDQIRLGHQQNFFSISFSSKAYTMPEGVKFRYRLQEFDDWTETSGRNFANYTNVPPGEYTFQLQVANNEGIWNPEMLQLPIYIARPYWSTWWFRVGILVLLGAIVYWWYRYRIDQVKKKEKLKSQYEKKLANVEMSALLAQMNPHFLFNSLNSIDSYIIRNESKKASEYLNNFARLMRLILQNSRSNYISLKDELEALELYVQMEGLRFGNRFEYEITVTDDIDTASTLIPPMLIQPYVENAIWHGLMHKNKEMPGKVLIRLSKQGDNILCEIEDNGIGRARAQELRAQKSSSHKRSMGMQITKDRIEMINKLYNTNTSVQVIDLDDEDGNAMGTKVELIIPV